MFKRKKSSRGFTLIELLVVIAIIGILAAIIAPNAFKAIEKSKVAAVESDYKAVKSATLMYYSDVGAWPIADNDFTSPDAEQAAFIDGPNNVTGWDGPYLEKWPDRDPWGGTYTLASYNFGTTASPEYYTSFGANKVAKSSAEKVYNDLGGDVVVTSSSLPSGWTDNGTNSYYLIFKIGMRQ